MSLDTNLLALITAFGADVKAFNIAKGDLGALTTTAKGNLVAAINEVHAALAGAGAEINDAAGDGATTETWSANKIFDEIAAAKIAVRDELRAGAGAALDTFAEIAAELAADDSTAAALATAVAARVRFDAAQVLSAGEKTQARSNIGAADAAALATLTAGVGATNTDYLAAYNTAKA